VCVHPVGGVNKSPARQRRCLCGGSRTFDDNVILFTDGMANEGVADSTELLAEIRRRVDALRDECHFDDDYTVKFSTLGTGGFLPELIYDIGHEFSTDPFYFVDDRYLSKNNRGRGLKTFKAHFRVV